jgi:hypothetical protein
MSQLSTNTIRQWLPRHFDTQGIGIALVLTFLAITIARLVYPHATALWLQVVVGVLAIPVGLRSLREEPLERQADGSVTMTIRPHILRIMPGCMVAFLPVAGAIASFIVWGYRSQLLVLAVAIDLVALGWYVRHWLLLHSIMYTNRGRIIVYAPYGIWRLKPITVVSPTITKQPGSVLGYILHFLGVIHEPWCTLLIGTSEPHDTTVFEAIGMPVIVRRGIPQQHTYALTP